MQLNCCGVFVLGFTLASLPMTLCAQSANWTQPSRNPGLRYGSAMAYDSNRQVLVLFGGSDYRGTLLNDTWEWNGTTWVQSIGGPSARKNHAMVYDSVRRTVYLFGGRTASSESSEIWRYTGTSWTQSSATGPGPRSGHAMSYDSVRSRTVMFGGANSQVPDAQTWEWTGNLWIDRSVAGPSPRYQHAMAFDPVRNSTVMHGGTTSGGVPIDPDVWEWNGSSWTRNASAGPGLRSGSSMIYDSVRQRVVVMAGTSGANSNLLWDWNGTNWTSRSVVGPSARQGAAAAFDSGRGIAVLMGGRGFSSETFGDLWELDSVGWAVKSEVPEPRSLQGLSYDISRSKLVLFGGSVLDSFGPDDHPMADTWEWDGVWKRKIIDGPRSRYGHAMVYDSARAVTVLFGGAYELEFPGYSLQDTWEYDGTAWIQRASSGPTTGSEPQMVYDSNRHVVVLRTRDQTWEWDGSSWAQRLIAGPSNRQGELIAYDADRHIVVLFGGYYYTPNLNTDETWEYDGNVWVQRNPTVHPSGRAWGAMDYDPNNKVCMLYGGGATSFNVDEPTNETWCWNGQRWFQMNLGPAARMGCSMVFDSDQRRFLCFGGALSPAIRSNDIWSAQVTCIPATISQHPASVSMCGTTTSEFSIVAAGTQGIQYRWQWRRGDLQPWSTIVEGPNLINGQAAFLAAGSGTSALRLRYLSGTFAAEGAIRNVQCTASNQCGIQISSTAVVAGCAADFNCDQVVDLFDYLDFVQEFVITSDIADFDGDGTVDFFDYLEFLSAFSAPC